MSAFAVPVTLIHPEDRARALTLDLLVDTGALYTLLPAEVVARLELRATDDWQAQLASGERVVYPLGEVRLRLGGKERTTLFVAGPTGCPALLGALALETFGMAADPVHARLVPVVGHL
jgi:aspartyl protease family protein